GSHTLKNAEHRAAVPVEIRTPEDEILDLRANSFSRSPRLAGSPACVPEIPKNIPTCSRPAVTMRAGRAIRARMLAVPTRCASRGLPEPRKDGDKGAHGEVIPSPNPREIRLVGSRPPKLRYSCRFV